MRKATLLALADGRVFTGESLGAEGESHGEVVFNTSMTGYQEIMTDPSYKGQMVVMTYPLMGNYGVNDEDVESRRPWVEGFVVKEASSAPSSWRGKLTLDEYMRRHGIVGIQGIDTRALTRHIRDRGAQEGVISTRELVPERLVARARAAPGLVGRDLVREVTVDHPFEQRDGLWDRQKGYGPPLPSRFNVVAYDCGVKLNILRQLAQVGCRVTVIPASTPAAAVLELGPDGVILPNGPGDPEGLPYLIESASMLIGRVPILGICLGHQVLGLAVGGHTYKLKFGHHGANHPVQDLLTGKVEITAQNHGFAVDPESIRPFGMEATHVNLNDGTLEGMRHREWPVFSVQYHPEASPGPHDANYLFRRFVDLMVQTKGGQAVPCPSI
ncbi:MAG: glutamine-hydrolyzing carbamoyl-phosphate synthase small subunit [Candidatus Methylomirabilia bacterium]